MPQEPRPADRLAALLSTLNRDHSVLVGEGDNDSLSQLVFLGNPQDPCPRLLLLDARLEPVDIVTWQIMRIHAQPGQSVAFPSYAELMRWVRVSRATLARALLMLRLTRWLCLLSTPRQAGGRFANNVYALVDESLPLTESLRFDDGYVALAERARSHRTAHIREVAAGVLDEIATAARSSDPAALGPAELEVQLGLRFEQLRALLAPISNDRVQNVNTVARSSRHGVRNLNAVSCSSSKKITTTTDNSHSRDAREARIEFPSELTLTDSQRRVLALRLAGLTSALCRDVLDEATARILAKRRTSDPVRCEFDYVARLASLALKGEFTLTDAGARFRTSLETRAASERALERAHRESERRRLEQIDQHRARRDNS